MEINNWILKKHINNLNIILENYLPDYPIYLSKKNILINQDFSKSQTFINWNLYPKAYDFIYDFKDNESKVRQMLKKSELTHAEYVSMDFGPNNPVVQMKTEYFIENWLDFIIGAQYESVVVSNDGKSIIEFTKDYHLISTFLIER